MAHKFTDKQLKFTQEYLIDLNATQSAIRAGYSKKTAKSQGQRLLTNVYIKEKITSLQKKTQSKLEIKKETILNQQNKINQAYEILLDLSLKDKLSSDEELKYARLICVVKANDSTRASEFISKHLGWTSESDDKEDNNFNFKIDIITKDAD